MSSIYALSNEFLLTLPEFDEKVTQSFALNFFFFFFLGTSAQKRHAGPYGNYYAGTYS